jgi:hypothetical protein
MTVKTIAPPGEAARPPRSPEPLATGDRLVHAEFERSHRAHPEIKMAELIAGAVYIPPRVKHERHEKPHLHPGGWATTYLLAATPGVDGSDDATVRLDNQNEVQPEPP